MPAVRLIPSASESVRTVEDADELLRQYRNDTGCYYLEYQSIIPADVLILEDISVTLLVNSRVGRRAFNRLQLYAASVDRHSLSQALLEHAALDEKRQVRDMILVMAQWPGLAASVATKVLHKKRPIVFPCLITRLSSEPT